MTTTQSEDELGRRLLLARGFQWLHGAEGDPYSLLLRAESDDPQILAQRIRERGALYRCGDNSWVTAHHAVGAAVLGDPRFGRRHPELAGPQEHGITLDDLLSGTVRLCHIVSLDEAFLHLERDDYTRLGRLLEPRLGGGVLDLHRAGTERRARRLLDTAGAGPAGGFDLVTGFARPLAVAAAADLLGVPEERRERFATWCAGLVSALDATLCAQRYETVRTLFAAIEGTRRLLTECGGTRSGDASDDPFAGVWRDWQDPDDALAAGMLITVAGVEVTAHLIAASVDALLDEPGQWAALAEDPAAIPGVVTETLRYAPPVRLESRVARTETEVAGETLAAGDRVVVCVAAANRDPAVFTEPDRFDPSRAGSGQRALDGDPVTAFVLPVARAQAESAVRVLAERLPALARTGPVLHRMRSAVVRGVLRLPVTPMV
ncbi:cytochrome P450 family protein [Streptomyces sp. NPDC055036]